MLERLPCAFVDSSERDSICEAGVSLYEVLDRLGGELIVTILNRSVNQTYQDKGLRAMFTDELDDVSTISSASSGRYRN